MINFETAPERYRHWKLEVDGRVATLSMDVQEDETLAEGYKLKLNSYDLGVDIELSDAVQRLRFEHPEVRAVVVKSLKPRIFCAGANIYMLGSSTHTFKVTARDYFGNTVESDVVTATTPPKTDNVAPTAPTNVQFSFQTAPPELWLTWSPSNDDTDSQELILYETYLNGVLVLDGNVGGTNTIAYCRDIGPTTVVLRAVDTSGNRSGPSNELHTDC